jgi:molecular chaperone DnaK (HSP70)
MDMLTMEKAAKLAGLFPITLIKEPEAAALYTLHMMQEKALAVSLHPSCPL